jgi:hypothetical protein
VPAGRRPRAVPEERQHKVETRTPRRQTGKLKSTLLSRRNS